MLNSLSRHLPQPIFHLLALTLSLVCVILMISLGWLWTATQKNYRVFFVSNLQSSYSLTFFSGVVYTSQMETFHVTFVPASQPGTMTTQFANVVKPGEWRWGTYVGQTGARPAAAGPYDNHAWGLSEVSSGEINLGIASAGHALALPAYFFEVLLLIGAFAAFYLYRKNRFPLTHCQSCGYNLSGNPFAPACPECGKANPSILVADTHQSRADSHRAKPSM